MPLVLAGCTTGEQGARSPEPDAAPAVARYVAIGDSYSAGPLIPVTDVAKGCLRSDRNYPSLVAEATGATLADRTCSGATTTNFSQRQFPEVPPQRTALNENTSLVTVSLGGNDEGVFNLLVRAFSGTEAAQDELIARLDRTQARLTTVLDEVHRLAPNADVLAVGYPQLVEADRVCDLLPLDPDEYTFAEDVNRRMTDVIRQAAAASGSAYVDVWKATEGHDVCSEDPWINGRVTQRGKAASFHPFAAQHRAVAKTIVSMLGAKQ